VGREGPPARRRPVERHRLQTEGAGGTSTGDLHPHPLQQRHLLPAGPVLRAERLRLRPGGRSGPGELRGHVPALRKRGPRRARRGRVAGGAALVQRQGRDVGRLLRRLRPVGDAPELPASSHDHRARGGRRDGGGFPGAEQHPRALPDAMGDLHQRRHPAAEPLRRCRVLDLEVPPAVPVPASIPGFRPYGGEPLVLVPARPPAPAGGRAVEIATAERGGLREDRDPDPHDHRALRRRPVRRDALLPQPHGARHRRGAAAALPRRRSLGPRRHPDAERPADDNAHVIGRGDRREPSAPPGLPGTRAAPLQPSLAAAALQHA